MTIIHTRANAIQYRVGLTSHQIDDSGAGQGVILEEFHLVGGGGDHENAFIVAIDIGRRQKKALPVR